MSLEKAFLADIVANPDDDAPRLVFADWFQDNGDSDRADFIRAHVELARPRLTGGTQRRRELQQRATQLFQAHGKRWAERFGDWCSASFDCWSRGFPVM